MAFTGALYAYPWDLVDDGLDRSLDWIADLAGCQEVVVAPSYHVSNYFLPHNPKRLIYQGEGGAVYFSPDVSLYRETSIKPWVSEVVTSDDYFDRIVGAIRKRGLTFSAWIVYLFNHNLSARHPEFAKHDAFGTPYVGQLSPSPSEVREYAVALTKDIVGRYRPEAVRVEALQRQAWPHGFLKNKFVGEITPRCQLLLSLCFNPASVSSANDSGMDGSRFQEDVAAWLRKRLGLLPTEQDKAPVSEEWVGEAFGGRLRQYLDSTTRSATALWTEVADVIHAAGSKVALDLLTEPGMSWTNGLDPSIEVEVDRLTTNPTRATDPKKRTQELLCRIGRGGELFAPVGPGNITEPEPLVKNVRAVAKAGCAGALFYNFGLLREEQLQFIGTAMRSL